MDWSENDENQNDQCSSVSTPAESTGSNHSPTANTANNTTKTTNQSQCGSVVSANQDSMSDGDLSDFSLNDTDDDGKFVVTRESTSNS